MRDYWLQLIRLLIDVVVAIGSYCIYGSTEAVVQPREQQPHSPISVVEFIEQESNHVE